MLVQSVLEIEKKEYVEQYIEHTLPSNKLNNKVNNKSVIYAKAPDFVESNLIFNFNTVKSSSIEFLLTSPSAV